ncbi:MAG: mtrB [Mycobacterium sp.]|nr:mtrB [Mycobacterium sp.]
MSRRSPLGWWRGSLQVRVVATTLVLSTAVLAVVGAVVLHEVGRGLLDAQLRTARAQTESGVASAQTQLQQLDRDDPASVDQALDDIVLRLSGAPSAAGDFYVALLPTDGVSAASLSSALERDPVAAGLRQRVGVRQAEAYTYQRVAINGRPRQALVIGAPVTAPTGRYGLFFVYPVEREQQTLDLVRQRLAVGGAALVLLLGAITALVTRQVVRPVRSVARSAGRLAAGNLTERLPVRGQDELATLATAFNDMAASLERQIGRLERLSSLQQRFTADVSHELRTPLTTVRMAAEVLHAGRHGFPSALSRSAELLVTEVDRFDRLLADLLEISRHDAGAAVLSRELVDLAALVTAEVDAVRRRHPAPDLRLVRPAGPLAVEADARRVARVVRNLVSNAVAYGGGAPVEVELRLLADAAADGAPAAAEPTGGWVEVRVADSGPGIDEADRQHVFDRFWRADQSRSRQAGGTGLGLAIATEDAALHGGQLSVEPTPGGGATFRLLLPVLPGAPLPDDLAGPPEAQRSDGRHVAASGGSR